MNLTKLKSLESAFFLFLILNACLEFLSNFHITATIVNIVVDQKTLFKKCGTVLALTLFWSWANAPFIWMTGACSFKNPFSVLNLGISAFQTSTNGNCSEYALYTDDTFNFENMLLLHFTVDEFFFRPGKFRVPMDTCIDALFVQFWLQLLHYHNHASALAQPR